MTRGKERQISRRKFLAGAGVAGAIAASGAISLSGCGNAQSSSGAKTESSTAANETTASSSKGIWALKEVGDPKETIKADIAIIGGGGTGVAAAIEAVDLGLKPVIVERLADYGGSFVGTEGITGFETKFTKALGDTYTVKQAVATCLNYHHWIPQHKLYDAFFGQTSETIDWLEKHNVKIDHVVALGISPLAWHIYDKGDSASPGGHFMKSIGAEAKALGVEAHFLTFGRKILMEDGKAVGILAENDKGDVIKIEAPVVMLASGGYANNLDFLYEVSETRNENIQGLGMNCRDADGIKMAKDVGAAMAEGLGTVMWCGPVPIDVIEAVWTTDTYSSIVQPTMWLNENGERFCREDLWLEDFAAAGICVRNQKKTYVLFTEEDMKRWETVGPDGDVFSFGKVGTPLAEARKDLDGAKSVHVGDDLAKLCEDVGLDPASVQATVDEYNKMCAAAASADPENRNADTVFGKKNKYMNPIETGPFWLVETADAYYTTVGGIKVNEHAQVIDEEGEPIPGLYAGGCDAGGLYGDSYDVAYAPGSQASWALNSGRLAMKHASNYLKA